MSSTLPERKLEVPEEVDLDDFFSMPDGGDTLVGHSDLEKTVNNREKNHFKEIDRYWVNKPYAYVVIYRSTRESEHRYVAVEPYLTDTEEDLVEFLGDKLRLSIDYEEVKADATPQERARVVRNETVSLMKRYNLVSQETLNPEEAGFRDRLKEGIARYLETRADQQAVEEDDSVDPVPVPRDPQTGEIQKLTDEQIEKILYYLVRNFIRFDKIDPIKNDINVEDISCDGYNSPVFVYHTEYGQMITNIEFGEQKLDDFVIKMAQNAGKGISKRQPDIDATLKDGSRAQLTLGREISDKGTNFTIRQFKDVPFTPVDLINWHTFSLEQMVYFWFAIENEKSMIVAGGTASGKTTTLNAISLFLPSTSKIVSIEDTREIEIPQANWVPSKTRSGFQEGSGDIDEFDLLENALRQRPDYVIMGEVRGEEGRTLFQVMSTGHTTYTTFHADNPKEVIRRFTTDPINVAPSMFGSLDLISNQSSVEIGGSTVRRNTGIVEIDEYNAKTGDYQIDQAFRWDPDTDEFMMQGDSGVMEDIARERGWTEQEFEQEWQRRRVVLSYLINNGINTYAGVAAALQGYMNDPETILTLIAEDELADRLTDLRDMKNIDIDVDPEKEALVPRPEPDGELLELTDEILDNADSLLTDYIGRQTEFKEAVEDLGDLRGETEAVEPDEMAVDEDEVETGTSAGEYSALQDPVEAAREAEADDERPALEAGEEDAAESDDIDEERLGSLFDNDDDDDDDVDADTEAPDGDEADGDTDPDESDTDNQHEETGDAEDESGRLGSLFDNDDSEE